MKKEDILSKAQREGMLGVDEVTKQMKSHGRLIGQIMFSAKNEIDYGVLAMFLGYLAGETFVEWRFKKNKVFLFLSIVASCTTILALIGVACSMFGVAL